jgi:hypothetical protein
VQSNVLASQQETEQCEYGLDIVVAQKPSGQAPWPQTLQTHLSVLLWVPVSQPAREFAHADKPGEHHERQHREQYGLKWGHDEVAATIM